MAKRTESATHMLGTAFEKKNLTSNALFVISFVLLTTAYFSEAFLNENHIDSYPADILFLPENINVDMDKLESQLYDNLSVIPDDARFYVRESIQSQAVDKIMGGYLSGTLWAILLLISGFLFLYNLMNMLVNQEIRQYGLIRVIGCDTKQIKRLIYQTFTKQIGIGKGNLGFTISKPWYTTDEVIYSHMLISQKGFERLNSNGIIKEVFQIDIDIRQSDEPMMKEELLQLVGSDYLVCNSDTIKKEWGYIISNRLIMGVICGTLLVITILNYICVFLVNILNREKTFRVMENVGMTRRQLRSMLLFEGLCYAVLTLVLVAVIGVPLFLGLGNLMKEQISYFTPQVPWTAMAGLFFGILGLCISVPCVYTARKK